MHELLCDDYYKFTVFTNACYNLNFALCKPLQSQLIITFDKYGIGTAQLRTVPVILFLLLVYDVVDVIGTGTRMEFSYFAKKLNFLVL